MANPIKVLVLDTVLERGGAEAMTMNYMRNMDRSSVQYDFLVNRPYRADYEDEVEQLGGRIFRMCPMYPQHFVRYKREFRSFLLEHPEYRIIHSNLEERSYFPLKVAAELKIPVRISHAHNVYRGLTYKTVFREYFRRQLKDYPTHRFACSRDAGIWLYGSERTEHGDVTIMLNAIDTNAYRFNQDIRTKLRREYNLGDKFVVGNVGRLTRQKNHLLLLEIFYQIKKRTPGAVLLLVGDGELKEKIRTKAADLQMQDSIICTGAVGNVADYLQAMDVFVFPSLFEGLGIASIEAQATGLKVFHSDMVPKECDLTGNVETISLRASPEEWAAKILANHCAEDRASAAALVKDAGYDIKANSLWLQNFYISEYEKTLR